MIARTTGGSSSTSATAASDTKRSRWIPGVGFVGGASEPTPFGLLMMRSFRADAQQPDAVVVLRHNVERDLLQRRVHVDRRSAQVQLDVVLGVGGLAAQVVPSTAADARTRLACRRAVPP